MGWFEVTPVKNTRTEPHRSELDTDNIFGFDLTHFGSFAGARIERARIRHLHEHLERIEEKLDKLLTEK